MTKPLSRTVEEIADTRATKALREVSDAVAELPEVEMMLKGLAAAQTHVERRPIAAETQTPPKDGNPRLAYTVPELARKLGVHRRTIEKKIKAGVLVSTKQLGTRLVSAESVNALFEPQIDETPARGSSNDQKGSAVSE